MANFVTELKDCLALISARNNEAFEAKIAHNFAAKLRKQSLDSATAIKLYEALAESGLADENEDKIETAIDDTVSGACGEDSSAKGGEGSNIDDPLAVPHRAGLERY